MIAGVLAGALAAVPAAAQQAWSGLRGDEGGAGLRACVAQAEQQRTEAWTCVGGELTTKRADGPPRTTVVAVDFRDTTTTQPGVADGDVRVRADD